MKSIYFGFETLCDYSKELVYTFRWSAARLIHMQTEYGHNRAVCITKGGGEGNSA